MVEEVSKLNEAQANIESEIAQMQQASEIKNAGDANNDKIPELGEKLHNASVLTSKYSQAAELVSSISSKLGNDDVAEAASIASQSLNVISLGMQAYAGNPMAGLAALDGLLSIGAGPQPDPTLEYLKQISQQIEDLAKEIRQNHVEVMTKLDHLQFLNEKQLIGIANLLADDIEICKNLIPFEFRVAEDGVFKDFVDIASPIHFGSYEDIISAYNSGNLSWPACRNNIERIFNQSIDVDPVFSMVFSVENFKEDANVNTLALEQQLDFFDSVLKAYQTDQTIESLEMMNSPEQYVLDWGDEGHLSRIELLKDFLGEQYTFIPTDNRYDLLDPIIVEKYVGYLLAVYPFYELLDNNDVPLPFEEMVNVSSDPSVLRALKKALAVVNLSLSQQSMMSGVGLSNPSPASFLAIDSFEEKWMKPKRHGKVQANEYKRWSNNVFRASIGGYARRSSLTRITSEMALKKEIPFALEDITEAMVVGSDQATSSYFNNTKKQVELSTKKDADTLKVVLHTTAPDTLDEYYSYEYTPLVPNLLRLQALLTDTILGYLGEDAYKQRRAAALLSF